MKFDIQKVARLANLTLTPEEEKKFNPQLNSILSYVEKIDEVNVTDTIPTSQVTGLENVVRNDDVSSSLTQDEALSGTNSKHEGLFKVKAVLEQ